MPLAFSVANYRTFRDEVTLDLTRRSLRTLTPRDGETWEELTWQVAAVYGANASGKSTLLDALRSLDLAVEGSRDVLHQPYLLDEQHPVAPTTYTIDFTDLTGGSRRYRYVVEAHSWGIAREELWEAERRWKRLFLRTQDRDDPEPTVVPGPSLRGATAEVRRITTPRDLFLAVALRYRHGAQLVFTTHDASLLGNSPTQLLERGEVWLCEKDDDGSADLYSVADFSGPRQGSNKERQYLAGAFGAVPRVDTSSLRHALTAPSPHREAQD